MTVKASDRCDRTSTVTIFLYHIFCLFYNLYIYISSTIRSIYKDASIPVTLSDAGIHKKIDILVAERQKLMKYKTPAKLADFQTRMKMLFVVTDEVPEIEKEFYMDQQTERLLHIF